MSGLKMLDLFSGIGGFHEGFKRAGHEFDWVGYSEIDKYASAVYRYNYKESEELGDIKLIRPGRDTPDNIDILCGGFPCQAFSVAGKRLGFDDTRGTLFFEIARLLTYYVENKRPIPCLVLENVKGLLSHDDGRTFAVIYRILSDLGYTIEFQLLNTRWWLPQNRERIYIVGYIGDRGGPQVFPIGESSSQDNQTQRIGDHTRTITTAHSHGTSTNMSYVKIPEATKQIKLNQIGTIGKDSEATRVYDANGISRTIKDGGGMGAKTGLYKVPEATKKGYAEAEVGDSINLSVPNSETRRGRVGKGEAQTLDTGMQQYTIQAKDDGVMVYDHYNNKIKSDGVACSLLKHSSNSRSTQKIINNNSIRRLTPVECCRLQGFPDDWNEFGLLDGKKVAISDTQRYKQAGNAVTVDVVQAVATIIKEKELI